MDETYVKVKGKWLAALNAMNEDFKSKDNMLMNGICQFYGHS
jgi:transposase-like protein